MTGTPLSRLGAELITSASGEFGFVTLADSFSTGSSLMPQKRNPDVFELARGKAGRMLGDLVALLTTIKGLPAGYQKDLQEDKALLFDACDTLGTVLPAVTGAMDTLTVNANRMAAGLDPAMRATDLAELRGDAGRGDPRQGRPADRRGYSSSPGTGVGPTWHLGAERRKPCHPWRCVASLRRVANRRATQGVPARSELVNPSLAASCWSVLAYRMR